MRLVELDNMSHADWVEVLDGEREPFGGVGELLRWSEKSTHVGIRDDHERLLALGGIGPAQISVAGSPPFTVIGLGSVIVTHSARRRGLARMLVARLLELAAELSPELGAERAMLFCLPTLMAFYAGLGFRAIDAPVWAEQPGGPVEMPLRAMWKALHATPGWPAGRVEVLGEPF